MDNHVAAAALLRELAKSGRKPSVEIRSDITTRHQYIAHRAAATGDLQVLQDLFALKFDELLSTPDISGKTPAHFAAENNHHDVFAFLIAAGANVNKKALIDVGGRQKNLTPFEWGYYHYLQVPKSMVSAESSAMSKLERAGRFAHKYANVFMQALSRGHFEDDLANPEIMAHIWTQITALLKQNTIRLAEFNKMMEKLYLHNISYVHLKQLIDIYTELVAGETRMLQHAALAIPGERQTFHKLLPAFQRAINTAMLIFTRHANTAAAAAASDRALALPSQLPAMPLEMWLMILSMLTQNDFADLHLRQTKTTMRDLCVLAVHNN